MTLDLALSRLSYRPPAFEPGHVWLAGAGPGDPGCLTLDVLAALAAAEAVVYDALVSPQVLEVARGAQLHFAGKRGGRPSMPQREITDLLVELARSGRRVLRLKGGDPYVFGRGGEEAMDLARADIPFRILPGLTSAFGALASVGIPATMRGINKAITLATGHAAGTDDDLDWAALARTGQPIVVYMGLKNLSLIASALLDGGMPADTPAAVVQSATMAEERTVVATVATIAAKAEAEAVSSPALVVFGHIVSMRAALRGER